MMAMMLKQIMVQKLIFSESSENNSKSCMEVTSMPDVSDVDKYLSQTTLNNEQQLVFKSFKYYQ